MTWKKFIRDCLMCDVSVFRQYRNDGALRGKHLTAAAIVGQDGTVWAESSNFPSFLPGEVTAIMQELNQPATFLSIDIGGRQYELIGAAANGVVRGERGAGGVTIQRTRTALIIGMYEEPLTIDVCDTIVESLGYYFINTLHM